MKTIWYLASCQDARIAKGEKQDDGSGKEGENREHGEEAGLVTGKPRNEGRRSKICK